ncbi:hypothetical protein [Micromonospora rifamycinica]|uniref:Uncharacterized protein n=1 Tax=Micromonospora rifamycinica TaxID=291594 RepID=A0A1C5JKX9_9ACTN|nr:hypothetical protein [Micromonospora rifamycinica]SCG70879.1 hypothetical protein GA0070623_3548 [Micromonospora rifamycinica]
MGAYRSTNSQGMLRQAPLLTFAWMLRLRAAATGPHSSVSS